MMEGKGGICVLDPFGGTSNQISHGELSDREGVQAAPEGKILSPSLMDLITFPQEPGFEHRETLFSLACAAKRSGVGIVGLMPDVVPVTDHDGVVRTLRDGAQREKTGVQFLPHGALSVGLEHEDIAPMGELKASGVRMVTDGGRPVRDPRFLRRALEYALNFELPVLLQPLDPELSAGGLAPEGPEATRYGLPSIPDAAERLAVLRAGELARLTGAHIVLFPVVTEAGLDALELVRRRGARVDAGTALPYLTWSVNDLATFDGLYRIHPPLWREPDIKALADAVRGGVLNFLSTGHRAVNLSEKATELPQAEHGMATLPVLWDLLLKIEREREIPLLDLVKGFSSGPAKLLKLETWTNRVIIGNADATAGRTQDGVTLAQNLPDLGAARKNFEVLQAFGGAEGSGLIPTLSVDLNI